MVSVTDLYTSIPPSEIWKVYDNLAGLFRGGGSDGSPKLVTASGPRARDFNFVYDPIERCQIAVPDVTKGLSFSTTVERLRRIPIPGRVWLLPRGAILPEGLQFNFRDRDHPLLNVSRRMPVVELLSKLTAISALLKPTEVRIK